MNKYSFPSLSFAHLTYCISNFILNFHLFVVVSNTHTHTHRCRHITLSYLHAGSKKEFLLWKWLRASEPLT